MSNGDIPVNSMCCAQRQIGLCTSAITGRKSGFHEEEEAEDDDHFNGGFPDKSHLYIRLDLLAAIHT